MHEDNGWGVAQLSDVAVIKAGGTPSRDSSSFWDGDIPWLTPGELTRADSKVTTHTKESLTAAGVRASGAVVLPVGSLLVTTRATLGMRTVAGVPIATNQGFKNLVFDGRVADPSLYYHLFEILLLEIVRRASGTTFLEISGKQLGTIKVPVPPLAEQRRIAEILDAVDGQIGVTRRILKKASVVEAEVVSALLRTMEWRSVPLAQCVRPQAPITYGIVQAGPHVDDGIPIYVLETCPGRSCRKMP